MQSHQDLPKARYLYRCSLLREASPFSPCNALFRGVN
jgi:hypothetical protein